MCFKMEKIRNCIKRRRASVETVETYDNQKTKFENPPNSKSSLFITKLSKQNTPRIQRNFSCPEIKTKNSPHNLKPTLSKRWKSPFLEVSIAIKTPSMPQLSQFFKLSGQSLKAKPSSLYPCGSVRIIKKKKSCSSISVGEQTQTMI
ncbi:unnamed protein product [Blepharisma stoltei]|uniref:Uncharacterized protein n=1 Tax=Blepharisma stoltei TaxID=1481888 RepID=A0AAU9JYD4_9CILI|nr:unnamed protein product [Blepharisma stoltei]